jgi:hypothetical protein
MLAASASCGLYARAYNIKSARSRKTRDALYAALLDELIELAHCPPRSIRESVTSPAGGRGSGGGRSQDVAATLNASRDPAWHVPGRAQHMRGISNDMIGHRVEWPAI